MTFLAREFGASNHYDSLNHSESIWMIQIFSSYNVGTQGLVFGRDLLRCQLIFISLCKMSFVFRFFKKSSMLGLHVDLD